MDEELKKIVKVIDSCKTKEQFLTSMQYCKLWIDKHAFRCHNFNEGLGLSIRYEFLLQRIINKMSQIL